METKRKMVFLEPFIINKIDKFIKEYVPHTRGRVINIVVSLFLLLEQDTQKQYINKAKDYIKNSDHLDFGVKYGEKRKGKKAVAVFISSKLEKKFSKYNDKILIIAALLYVGIIKDGE